MQLIASRVGMLLGLPSYTFRQAGLIRGRATVLVSGRSRVRFMPAAPKFDLSLKSSLLHDGNPLIMNSERINDVRKVVGTQKIDVLREQYFSARLPMNCSFRLLKLNS